MVRKKVFVSFVVASVVNVAFGAVLDSRDSSTSSQNDNLAIQNVLPQSDMLLAQNDTEVSAPTMQDSQIESKNDGQEKKESAAETTKDNKDALTKEVKAADSNDEYKAMFKNAKLKGFVFGRFYVIDGKGGSGFSHQFRAKLDLTTGAVRGYSLTGGIFFGQGSGAIDANRRTAGDVQGARGTAYSDSYSDRFNVAQLFASKAFNSDSIDAKIDLGKMNIDSPLTNKSLDLGIGAHASVVQKIKDVGKITYDVKYFDSFNTDHANYNIRRRGLGGTSMTSGIYTNATLVNQEAASVGIGNNMTMVHVKAELFKALKINALYTNIYGLFDYMTFADASYNIKMGDNHELTILGQFAMAGMSKNAHIDVGKGGSPVTNNFDYEFAHTSAKTRGIFNVQAKYKYKINQGHFDSKLGFLGSFGDGYGVLLAHRSGIDTAGKLWDGNLTATYDGLGFLGSGSFKNTSIYMAYLSAGYTFASSLKLSLDVSYIFGDNNYPLLNAAMAKKPVINRGASNGGANSGGTLVGGNTKFINAKFFEIAPQISYKFFKNFEGSIVFSVFTGDINFFKTRTELKWTF